MLPVGLNTFTFVEFDGVKVMQYDTDKPATLPLDAMDTELLKGFSVHEVRSVNLGRFEMEMFAGYYSQYLRAAGEVTKVAVIGFANLLLKEKILTGAAQRAARESPTDPCVYGDRCPICKGTLTQHVCRSSIVATIEVQDILIGLNMIALRGGIKLDSEQEYFWPTRSFLNRLCRMP